MASPVDTSVKRFANNMPGISGVILLGGQAGRLKDVFDLCLVNGATARSVSSLVVSGGIATVTLSTDALNVNLENTVQLIEGVSGGITGATNLNGEQRILTATATTLTFATAVVNGTATGTITTRLAPAGWASTHTGTNKAEYHSTLPLASGFSFRLDDTGTTSCKFRGYETMSDVDTGTGDFPTEVEWVDGVRWSKSSGANANANDWDLVTDGRFVIWSPATYSGNSPGSIGQSNYAFGDLIPHSSIDPYAVAVIGAQSAPTNTVGSINRYDMGSAVARLARGVSGVGGPVTFWHLPECVGTSNSRSGADNQLGAFPPPDNRMRLAAIMVNQGNAFNNSDTVPRAMMPGYYHVPHSALQTTFQRGDFIVPSAGPLAGRALMCVMAGAEFSDSTSSVGRSFIDVTGPWR